MSEELEKRDEGLPDEEEERFDDDDELETEAELCVAEEMLCDEERMATPAQLLCQVQYCPPAGVLGANAQKASSPVHRYKSVSAT